MANGISQILEEMDSYSNGVASGMTATELSAMADDLLKQAKEETPEIEREMNRLQCEIYCVYSLIEDLTKRLDPVIGPEIEKGEASKKEPCATQMGRQIHTMRASAEAAAQMLRDLLKRLAI